VLRAAPFSFHESFNLVRSGVKVFDVARRKRGLRPGATFTPSLQRKQRSARFLQAQRKLELPPVEEVHPSFQRIRFIARN
jgi:hypothetical protein